MNEKTKSIITWLFGGIGGAIIAVLIAHFIGENKQQTNIGGIQAGRDIRDSTIMQSNPDQEKIIREIESKISPSVTFNEKEEYSDDDDNDALDYIEDIKVHTENIGGSEVIKSIVIYPKIYLETIPSLEPLDVGYQVASKKRGKKFEIIYTIQQGGALSMKYENQRFRLEIRNPPRDHIK